MKLSDIKGEQAFDVLADLLEPLATIMSDSKIKELVEQKVLRIKIVQYILKEHKTEAIQILAIMEQEDFETYKERVNVLTLPLKLLEIFNDKDFVNLFMSQAQITEMPFGSVMANTEASEE